MRFQAQHHFGGSREEVAQILVDPQFYRTLALPDVSLPEVLDSSSEGDHSSLRLRYEFVGSLDAMARRVVGHHRLSWVQELVVRRDTGAGDLEFSAQADPRRLFGSAHFTLDEEAGGCTRRLAGELVVAVPLIGSKAEGRIVPGVTRRLDIEAQAINDVLAGRRR